MASFRHAGRGLVLLVRTQPNARIHLAATAATIVAGWALRVDAAGWRWLVAAIAAVWAAEAFNTALERLCDAVHPAVHPGIRDAKDAAAGAVLATSAGAAFVGLLTLGPPLWERLNGR
ncbi:MAG: diacylglycerol kinase family protein [Planctomycetota bacterium]